MNAVDVERAAPGIEPGTSRTQTGNHTTRPSGRVTPSPPHTPDHTANAYVDGCVRVAACVSKCVCVCVRLRVWGVPVRVRPHGWPAWSEVTKNIAYTSRLLRVIPAKGPC